MEAVGILILDFLASGTIKNKLLLFITYPVYSILSSQSEWTNAGKSINSFELVFSSKMQISFELNFQAMKCRFQ